MCSTLKTFETLFFFLNSFRDKIERQLGYVGISHIVFGSAGFVVLIAAYTGLQNSPETLSLSYLQ